MSQHRVSTGFGNYPRPTDQWRTVAHMLIMSTGQFSHPVILFIPVVPHDWLLHRHTALAGFEVLRSATIAIRLATRCKNLAQLDDRCLDLLRGDAAVAQRNAAHRLQRLDAVIAEWPHQ